MGGAASSQLIWVLRGDVPTKISLGVLYTEYLSGHLGYYRVYYVDPETMEAKTVAIDCVYNNRTRMGVSLLSEDEKIAVVDSLGGLLTISDHADANITVVRPSDAIVYYGGESDGVPGNKIIYVRKIIGRSFVSITSISVPVPNVITDGFMVIVM